MEQISKNKALTPMDRLRLLEEWLQMQLTKLSQQRLQVGPNLGSQEYRDLLVENQVKERVLTEVMNQVKDPFIEEDSFADKYPPVTEKDLLADSW